MWSSRFSVFQSWTLGTGTRILRWFQDFFLLFYFKISIFQILDLGGLLVYIKNKMSKQFTYDVHRTIHFIFYSWSQDRILGRKITYSITKPQRWLNWFLLGRRKEKRIENTFFPLVFLSLNSTLCLFSITIGWFVFLLQRPPLLLY